MTPQQKMKVDINKAAWHNDATLYGWKGHEAKTMPADVHYFLFFECRKPINQMDIEVSDNYLTVYNDDTETFIYLDLNEHHEETSTPTEPGSYYGSWGGVTEMETLADLLKNHDRTEEEIIKEYINEFKREEA